MCRFKGDKSYNIKNHYQEIPATLPGKLMLIARRAIVV